MHLSFLLFCSHLIISTHAGPPLHYTEEEKREMPEELWKDVPYQLTAYESAYDIKNTDIRYLIVAKYSGDISHDWYLKLKKCFEKVLHKFGLHKIKGDTLSPERAASKKEKVKNCIDEFHQKIIQMADTDSYKSIYEEIDGAWKVAMDLLPHKGS